jgi:long-subunit fatty acid transport protein
MKTSRIYWLVILSIIGLQAVQAQYAEDALRFSQFGSAVGARSQAMGNTIVGIADDYSALFGNPAGLSQQKNFEFSIGLSRLGYGNDVTFFGKKTTGDNSVINLNNLGIVYPIATERGGLTFAFGFGRVASFASIASFDAFNSSSSIIRSFSPYAGTQYEDFDLITLSSDAREPLLNSHIPFKIYLADTLDNYLFPILTDSVQQTVRVLEGGGLNHWSFGGGIDIAENLSFGITLTFISGSYSYDREFTESDSRDIYKASYAFPYNFNNWTYTSTIESNISGFNALFGLMYRKPDKFRIGATVRIPTSYDISETFSDNGVSNFDDGFTASAATDVGETKYKITTPFVISGGISVQPLDWLLLAGDAEYTDWTELEFDTDNLDLLQENRNIKKLLRDTWNLRGGVEVSIWSIGLKLRGGIEWKPSPWKDDPSEYDQLIYTAGIGYEVDESSSINVSYALGDWKTFRDNYYWGVGPASRTSESITTNTVNLTYSHKF